MPPGRQLGGEENSSRSHNVKADDLGNVEALDEEEDGGWAGHHEEVDYSKVSGVLVCVG